MALGTGRVLQPPLATFYLTTMEQFADAIHSYCGATSPSSVVVTQNRAYYQPFYLPATTVITQLGWLNGGTVNGNMDLGIFSESGAKLVSTGATAQSGTNGPQVVNIADITLPRGRYYFGISSSSATATLGVWAGTGGLANVNKCFGMGQEASAHPLPATATFAASAESFVPLLMLGLSTVVP